MLQALRRHWPEYLMEGALLCAFMLSACCVAVLLGHPASPARHAITSVMLRQALGGLAMGSTAIALIYSPWGMRSGAHMNPSTTLTFWRLGKVKGPDAVFYALAQFAGGALGVHLAFRLLGSSLADVHFATTVPGSAGPMVAWGAEAVLSFGMMTLVLHCTNYKNLARLTGLFAGILVATYITLEGPLSGMSMNPARSFASALWDWSWSWLWIYFTAPPLGMLSAAELYRRRHGTKGVGCGKLHHQNDHRCIFCGFPGRRDAGS